MISNPQSTIECPEKIPPAGVELDFTLTNLESEIAFTIPRGERPLQPLVSNETVGNELRVSVIVFVNDDIILTQDNTEVIQDLSYTNNREPYLNLYMCYDVPPHAGSTFKAYRFDFTANFSQSGYTPNHTLQPPMPTPPNIKDIKQMTTFLWDEDPVTSRGTVTTVKDPLN